jgi:hypothetical protein
MCWTAPVPQPIGITKNRENAEQGSAHANIGSLSHAVGRDLVTVVTTTKTMACEREPAAGARRRQQQAAGSHGGGA